MENYKTIFQQKKVCVLVPTYNNEQTLAHVLESVRAFTDQVIVVNDGSTDSTNEIIARFADLEVVMYPVNQGKGFALRQGFKRAVALGYEHAISIDSDGQHFADDLPKFIDALETFPDAIIIGERNMNQSSVPGKSNFGKKFSNFWFKFETGVTLNDTQSGYRMYPVKLLKRFKFITRKFEFEIEVLVRAAWAGIPINEIPVKVFYPERGKRITHFRPFRDFSRISVLNTVLVTITLLYIKPRDLLRKLNDKAGRKKIIDQLFNSGHSDLVKAVSVGFGIFMGIFPVWGFQLIIAISLSFLFKLNKALVIIAANISIPPMIPLILFASHMTGVIWMGDQAVSLSFDKELTLEVVKESFFQYMLGAVTLSIGAGVFFGLITFSLLKIFRRQS